MRCGGPAAWWWTRACTPWAGRGSRRSTTWRPTRRCRSTRWRPRWTATSPGRRRRSPTRWGRSRSRSCAGAPRRPWARPSMSAPSMTWCSAADRSRWPSWSRTWTGGSPSGRRGRRRRRRAIRRRRASRNSLDDERRFRMKVVFALSIIALAALLVFGLRSGGGESQQVTAAQPAHPAPGGLAKATFAGGCFWCMEPPFDKTDGVVSTTSSYTGGHVKNPSYEQVSSGGTGHAESVQVVYDPSKGSYEKLLEVYWHNVDPTTPNRQ